MASTFLTELERHAAPPGLTLWALGGPSLAIQTPQTLIYLDLFTGPPPGDLHKAITDLLDPDDIRRADAALSTHHDPDHCHEASLKALHAHTDALFVGPASCRKLYREWGFDEARVLEVAANHTVQLKDLRITALPCNDYFDPQAVSYLLQSGGVTAFDGGDTLYYSGYVEVGRRYAIDLALLNFAHNPPGEIYYMNQAHVARTAVELGAKTVIPLHYDLWQEFLDDPAPLGPLLAPHGIGLHVLRQGERYVLTREGRPEA
jgi:L-ascorbate 6-phosphate lactonase